jgi:spectinomycin phosphotransferase
LNLRGAPGGGGEVVSVLEKPNLPDAEIVACLREQFDLPVMALTFLPIGNDSSAWVYRADGNGGDRWFVKLKRSVDEAALHVPHALRRMGLHQAVAPLPNRAGALWTPLSEFALIAYPYIDGDNGMAIGLTHAQWIDLGAAVRSLHGATLPPEIAGLVARENFVTPWLEKVIIMDSDLDTFRGTFAAELVAFWTEKRAIIRHILAQTRALGDRLRAAPPPFALCHADIHTANVLVEPGGALHIVDWDQPVFAPKERDLMFVIDGNVGKPIGSDAERWFFEGYGEAEVNRLALAYYRYMWTVEDMGDYAARVFFEIAGGGDDTRADAVRGFMKCFAPGDVVDAALALRNV